MDKPAIRRAYTKAAPWYDFATYLVELAGVRRLRRRLMQRAEGRVLEVAAGTGANFRHYPEGTRLVAVDLTRAMLERARERSARQRSPGGQSGRERAAHGQASRRDRTERGRVDPAFALMDGEALAVATNSVDTVTSTLTLCTFVDPVGALREMARVVRPGGRILLIEHGRSDRGLFARYQDRTADRHAAIAGCHWNREPLELVREAGLTVVSHRRTFLGVLHAIEATAR